MEDSGPDLYPKLLAPGFPVPIPGREGGKAGPGRRPPEQANMVSTEKQVQKETFVPMTENGNLFVTSNYPRNVTF